MNCKRNRKNGFFIGIILLALLFSTFTGCTVEFPEDLAADDPPAAGDTMEPSGMGETVETGENATSGDAAGKLETSEILVTSETVGATETAGTSSPAESAAVTSTAGTTAPSLSKPAATTTTKTTSTTTPQPVEPEDMDIDEDVRLTCTLTIRCDTILDNMERFNKDKMGVLPKDGVIYGERTVTFYEGESVFDVLLRETKKNRVHMEFERTPIYNSNYIEGINNLYEFDCGEGSGWMYKVNGWFPNYGCSRYQLKDGDRIEWLYTCDLGYDLGRTGTWDDFQR